MFEQGIPHFRVVCEGPTDFHVIDAALAAAMNGGDYLRTMIQPESSDFAGEGEAEMGRGWKGVRKWCGDRLRDFTYDGVAALIVHIDADVADEDEIACAQPCPPASATTDPLRRVVREWGGIGTFGDKVVLCTPSKNTEAWVLIALHPTHPFAGQDIECRPEPEALLVGLPSRLVRRKRKPAGTEYHKEARAYRDAVPRLASAWGRVRQTCTEAERFSYDLAKAILNTPPAVG